MNTAAYPSWVAPALPIPPADAERLERVASNFVKLFNHRKELTELDCLRIIALELGDPAKRRPDIVARVKAWYDNLRSIRERNELWKIAPPAPSLTGPRKRH